MASVVVTMDAREAALFRAQQKIIDQQVKMNSKFIEGGKASEQASQRTRDGLDKSKVSMDRYTVAIAGASAALGVVASAWAQINAEQLKAVASAGKVEAANRRNLQISSSSAEYKKSQTVSDAAAMKYGVDRNVARDVFFQSESGGFQGARDFVVKASVVIDPSTAATIATKFPAMFRGVDPETAIKLTEFSSKNSPLNFEQTAAVAPTTAGGMALLGASMEEALAAQSVMAKRFKGNGEQVSDALNSFSTSLGIDDRFAGKGFVEAYKTLQGLSEAEREKFLGSSQELNRAFKIIGEEMESIVSATQENAKELQRIRSGGGSLADQIRIADADPMIQASRDAVRAQITAEITNEEKSGVSGFRVQAAKSYAEASMLKNANLAQRTFDNQLNSFVGEIPLIGGMLGKLLPESNAQHIAGGLANLGVNPNAAGQIGAEVSMAATDPGGLTGALIKWLVGQADSSKVMADSADRMASSVEKMSLDNNQAGARSMAATASQ